MAQNNENKLLEVRGLTMDFGGLRAMDNVSLDIYAGETLGVLGANGAGKSTLLKIISGALRPDSGQVINYGASVSLLALQAGFCRLSNYQQ